MAATTVDHAATAIAGLAQRVLESAVSQLDFTEGGEAAAASDYGDPANSGGDNATLIDDGSGDDDGGAFDSTVFWSVNGFLLLLLMSMIYWCCCCNKDWLLNPEARRRESDAAFQARIRQRREQHESTKIDSPETRKGKLLASFERHGVTMVVEEEDLLQDNFQLEVEKKTRGATSNIDNVGDTTDIHDIETGDNGNAESDAAASAAVDNGTDDSGDNDMDASRDLSLADSINATGFLKLPERTGRQPVPNCCAVCLGEYDVGDKAVWSSNPSCAHAFHEECITGWLIKMQPETPCPCCRQEFTDLETIRKEKKIIWAGDAFNFGGIAL